MSMDDMKLPEGKIANSCIHFNKCSKMFGCKKHYTNCDFSPSRYREDLQQEIDRLKHTIREAYFEGWQDCDKGIHETMTEDWECSKALKE